MIKQYAKALLGAYAKKMRDVIHEVQANETDEIVVHKLAEIAADCAWCEREYGGDRPAARRRAQGVSRTGGVHQTMVTGRAAPLPTEKEVKTYHTVRAPCPRRRAIIQAKGEMK